MWVYKQSTGELSHDGQFISRGYAGHGEGKNNPAMQMVHDMGPLPRGRWRFAKPAYTHVTHGPVVMCLIPQDGTETFGRTHFLCHGDSKEQPGTASLGCMVQPRFAREQIAASPDCELEVIA